MLRALAEQGLVVFRVSDARAIAPKLDVAQSYVPVLLHKLAKGGWLQRVKHGTYALATGLPGFPEAHPFVIGMALVETSAVSGWTALNHHGLTEQIPRLTTLTTARRIVTPAGRGKAKAPASSWQVGEHRYEIVIVVPRHYFGFEEIWLGDSRARVFDRERSLLDCFALPRRFGGLGEGLGILDEHLHELDVPRLVEHATWYGKASVAKRVGWALEKLGVAKDTLEPLRALPMQGYRPLDPTKPAGGEKNTRWRLLENTRPKETV